MIKLTINNTLNEVCFFIEHKLAPLLAEGQPLHVKPATLSKTIKKNYILKNIDNTITYIEYGPDKAKMVLSTIKEINGTYETEHFGVVIRSGKSTHETEFYMDTLSESFKKGLLDDHILHKPFNRHIIALVATLAFMTIVFAYTGISVLFFLPLILVSYPMVYLQEKKKFSEAQKKMQNIVSIFKNNLSVTKTKDTKDWIDFFIRVRVGTNDIIPAQSLSQ